MKNNRTPFFMALITVALWGSLAVANKKILTDYSEMEVLFLTGLIVTIFIFLLNAVTGRLSEFHKLSLGDYVTIAALGFLGTFMYNMLYNYGIHHLDSQEACIINYIWPIMIMIFSCFVLHEKMTIRKAIAIMISFFGVVIIVTKLDFAGFQVKSVSGVMACIIAAVCYGLFSVLNKKKFYDQYIALNIYYLVMTIISGVIMVYQHSFTMPHGIVSIGLILWIGIFANGLAYLLWNLAIVYGDTAKISNLAYITPFLTILFSKIFLNEEISFCSLAGLAFILLGIFIQMGEKSDVVQRG